MRMINGLVKNKTKKKMHEKGKTTDVSSHSKEADDDELMLEMDLPSPHATKDFVIANQERGQ